MNYPPNIVQWKKGDLVIHDADAKRSDMLMKVIGFTKDGLVKTQYVDRIKHRRFVWKNPMAVLHDPRRFKILTEGLD